MVRLIIGKIDTSTTFKVGVKQVDSTAPVASATVTDKGIRVYTLILAIYLFILV